MRHLPSLTGPGPYLSAVISHFEDGRLPGDLLAIGLLCAALVLGV